jgi:hypothetical protein
MNEQIKASLSTEVQFLIHENIIERLQAIEKQLGITPDMSKLEEWVKKESV